MLHTLFVVYHVYSLQGPQLGLSCVESYGQSPLCWCYMLGGTTCLKLLVEYGLIRVMQ